MTDLVAAEAQWHDWVVAACRATDVDPALVDVTAIHDLTRDIAHDVARPMAPVGAFILGMAVARHGADRAGSLQAALADPALADPTQADPTQADPALATTGTASAGRGIHTS